MPRIELIPLPPCPFHGSIWYLGLNVNAQPDPFSGGRVYKYLTAKPPHAGRPLAISAAPGRRQVEGIPVVPLTEGLRLDLDCDPYFPDLPYWVGVRRG